MCIIKNIVCKKRVVMALCALFFYAVCSQAQSKLGTDGFLIYVNDKKMSAELDKVPLRRVINEIKRHTNILFRGDEEILNQPVSVSFNDLSIEKGLKRITSGLNTCMIFNAEGEVKELQIISNRNSGSISSSNSMLKNKDERINDFPSPFTSKLATYTKSKIQKVERVDIPSAAPVGNMNDDGLSPLLIKR